VPSKFFRLPQISCVSEVVIEVGTESKNMILGYLSRLNLGEKVDL